MKIKFNLSYFVFGVFLLLEHMSCFDYGDRVIAGNVLTFFQFCNFSQVWQILGKLVGFYETNHTLLMISTNYCFFLS